jgi:PAS domain S-box-containing protein
MVSIDKPAMKAQRVLLIAIWGFGLAVSGSLLHALYQHRGELDVEAQRETLAGVRIFARHADRVLWAAEDNLTRIVTDLRELKTLDAKQSYLQRQRPRFSECLSVVRVIDAQGLLSASSIPNLATDTATTQRLSVADENWFVGLRKGEANDLMRGEPVFDPILQRSVLLMLRSIEDKKGGFAGVVVGIIDPESCFHGFLDTVVTSAGDSAALWSAGKRVLVRAPAAESIKGELPVMPFPGPLPAVGAEISTLVQVSPTYGALHAAVKGLAAGGLVASYGRREENSLKVWYARAQNVGLALSGILGGNAIITWLVLRARRRDARTEAVLDQAGIALYRYSSTRGGLDFSDGVQALLGVSADELRRDPWHWQRSIRFDDVARVKALLANLAPGELFTIDYRLRHADGHWRWVHDRAVSITQNGAEIIIEGIAADITASKEAEFERERLKEELDNARVAQVLAEAAITEDHSRQLINSIAEAVIGIDNHACISSFNPAAERMFGHTEASVKGQSLHDLIHHTRADGSVCREEDCPTVKRFAASRTEVFGTDIFWPSNGHAIRGEYSFLPLLRDGHVAGAVMVIRDVTERELNAQRLRMLSRAVEESPAAISMSDIHGVISYVNARFTEMTGYTEAEVLGKTHKLIASGDTPPEVIQSMWAALTAGNEWSGDLLNRRRDGSTFWSHNLITPLRDSDGNLSHYLAISEDISVQRELEQRALAAHATTEQALRDLAEQEHQVRMLTDNVPALINYFDTDYKIVYCNAPYARQFGFEREQALGRPLRELLGDRIFDEIAPFREGAMAGNETFYEAERNGQTFAVTMRPARDAQGAIRGVYALMLDITADKRIARELKEALSGAEAANITKGRFLANISHEIRTPMNAIIGLSELLLRTRLDDRQRDYLQKEHRSALLLLGLLNDVLDFSKIESGQLRLDPHPFRLDDMLEQIADLYGDSANEKGVEFVIDIAPDLPGVVIGDSLRVTQVLSNLCSNAVKFTADGEITLAMAIDHPSAGGMRLTATVSDTGIGMSPEQAAHVFEAFAQADSSTTRRYGGTGLGLSICRNLVQLMGGELYVESESGRGSQFHLAVPLTLPVPAEELIQPLAGTEAIVLMTHASQRAAVAGLLRGLGASVEALASAAEALALCRQRVANQTAACLILSDEAGVADPEFAAWLHEASPLLILAWRQHLVQPSEWPQAQLLGRPVKRRALLQAIEAGRGCGEGDRTEPLAQHPDLAGAHILVIDDYALNIEIVTAYLHEAGCQVTVARDGREGLDCLFAGEFDAVLMDCQMPVMDGYEATRAIRQEPRWQQLPVIAMTANVMEGDREKCFVAGMNDFVPKPVIVDQLFAVLGKQLHGRRRLGHTPATATAVAKAEAPTATLAPPAPLAPSAMAGRGAPAAVDLTKLVNVDVDAALQSTMGLPGFLARVLRIFLTTQKDFDLKFAQALADRADPEAAGRAAHTLKGAAASIGAQALREASLVLEQACKHGAPDAEIQAALAVVMKEMHPVVGGVEAALGSTEKVGVGDTAPGAR